ncbi:hypothetical protein Vafri_4152 [Volvox africanus]|uniref:Uncharacterized protein n=1 Tax=Volvox africanus TaxID=51714 RepID=A0A8J4ATJ5_9CHLO|nr:hypothetical protein Vafri_4152 [Volvox africanus]
MLVHQRLTIPKTRVKRCFLSAPSVTRRSFRCQAEQSSTEAPAEPKSAAPSSSPAEETIEVKKVEAKAPLLQKGQGTAIVTGAISALLGIGYLALVWLLDSRGGQLQPPPPEAFIP